MVSGASGVLIRPVLSSFLLLISLAVVVTSPYPLSPSGLAGVKVEMVAE